MRKTLVLLACCLGIYIHAQNITPDRRTDWTPGFFDLEPDTVINVLDYGFTNDGSADCSPGFYNILIDFPTEKIKIYFPPGTYVFNGTLSCRSNMIIEGAGADSTFLKFNGNGSSSFIQVNGSIDPPQHFIYPSHCAKDDTYIIPQTLPALQAGDFIKLFEDDAGRITSVWSTGMIGQILEVDTVINNNIHFTRPLRMSFDSINNPRFSKINLVHHVMISCLSIERMDATAGQTSNIDFTGAAYCRINGIKSLKTNFAHVSLSGCHNVHVTNSYFKNAHAYGGGGQGYGVVLQFMSGNCLVQNNIFEHLRHSILLQAGANGNTVGYNYSRDAYWAEFPNNSAGDIVIHGNYPYMNLFESNSVQNIRIDESHGMNGPFNTFYRNRAELYGIIMTHASDNQNFVGNEIPGTVFGYFILSGLGHYSYGNNDGGTVVPNGTSSVTDTTLYLTADNPYYGLINDLPVIGYPNVLSSNQILAMENYSNGFLSSCLPQFTLPVDTNIASIPVYMSAASIVYPNPTQYEIQIRDLESGTWIEIYNAGGILIRKEKYNNSVLMIDLAPGIYILKVEGHYYKVIRS